MREFSFRLWFEDHDEPLISWHHDIPIYHKGLVKADLLHPGFVSVYDPEYYAEEGKGRRVFHDPEGELGFSLLPHEGKFGRKEIAGVYNHGGDRKKGWGVHAIRHAARHGGNYLEAFEGNDKFSLPFYYHKHLGAQPVGYLPWDDQYAPKNWNYEERGRPGIVQLEIPPHGVMNIEEWLRMDHKEDSLKEFQARLRKLKREAGIHMDENHKIQPLKHRDHCATPEEYDRLVDGVDEFYFNKKQPEQVQHENSREADRKRP